jgi:pimeloyl-ACP methyl ester carboxylesterase
MVPKTQYAKSGDVRIAYQVVGEGPFDLVFVPGFISNLDAAWEEPYRARVWTRLASFARLIMFDKRGTGLSDRTVGVPTLEERMDDVRAVMDAVGSQQAALFGNTVHDLVAGSNIRFHDEGSHSLKGLTESVRLFADER